MLAPGGPIGPAAPFSPGDPCGKEDMEATMSNQAGEMH